MDYTRLDGHQIGESPDATMLHPAQLEHDYVIRLDGYDTPLAACVSPAYVTPPRFVPIDETYSDIERNPSLILKYMQPGRTVFLLPGGNAGSDCTRLSLRQVHGYMVPIPLLRCG